MTKKKTTPTNEQKKETGSDSVVISPARDAMPKSSLLGSAEGVGAGISGIESPIPPLPKERIDLLTPEVCGEVYVMVFDRIAKNSGEHWKLSESEKATLGKTTSNAVNRYLGEMFGEYPEIAALAISAVVVLAPRLIEDGRQRKAKQLARDAINPLSSGQKPVLPANSPSTGAVSSVDEGAPPGV